jgi:hypothetical protein
MRSWRGAVLVGALIGLAASLPAQDSGDKTAEKVAAQKKAAEDNWDLVEAGPFAHQETKHLLLYVPKGMDKRLKDAGVLLEKHYDLAKKALAYDKEEPWTGKLTVYLFAERPHFTAFVRRVEKRRVMEGDSSSFSADDPPHAAAGPGRGKQALPAEAEAGEQVAVAMLVRKAGLRTPLPGWLTNGFGRATRYRAAPRDKYVLDERRLATRLSAKHSAADIWGGTLEADEVDPLHGSLADFLAYGPGASKFPALVEGFKPGENMLEKTMAQAMEAAGVNADRVGKLWKAWVQNPR